MIIYLNMKCLTLKKLECENNKIENLPELFYSLKYFNCCNNLIKELPKLP